MEKLWRASRISTALGNAACLGYCRMAMQNAGVDECTQRKVLRELKSCFDLVSVEEAAQAG